METDREQKIEGPASVSITTPAGVRIDITLPPGQTAGIATRTAENADGVRMLTTIKTGPDLDKVVFNVGTYGGGGVQTFGGGGGDPPECP